MELALSGFQDIENGDEFIDTDLNSLKYYQTVDTFNAKQSYYHWAREKLNNARFETTKDKLIWECHSEGMVMRRIASTTGFETSWICRKIKRLENYLKEQAEVVASSSMVFG